MPDVRVEDAAGVERVLIGNIGTDAAPDYGMRITSANGTTIILDGTSNMFKIWAEGTLVGTVAADAVLATATASHSNYPTSGTAPAYMAFLSQAVAGSVRATPFITYGTDTFVAATSGGAVTTKVPHIQELGYIHIQAVTTTINVFMDAINKSAGSTTWDGKYFILKELGE